MTEEPSRLIDVSSEMTEACSLAVKVWGQPQQLVQCMAECGECIAEVGRHFQGRDPDLERVTDEAVDILIMAMQIRQMVGQDKYDAALRRKFEKFNLKIVEAQSQMQPQAYIILETEV